ncbi:ABC transporter ATP-binding protein [Candidatus Wolfebacteria bacterium]|nr:ABC transporter ATP-binding protein [Candidatus Wolfebacteria bacterium]
MPALAVHNITKHFDGVKAVSDLSLTIEKGKITGIIGPNGSGKTTLVNVLSGLLNIDSGVVVVENTRFSRIRPWDGMRFGMTRTFQQVRLFNQMSVLDNILVVLTKRNLWSSFFEFHNDYHLHRAKEILERVDLWEKRHELAGNCSYGQRKLLEIARALATHSTSSGKVHSEIFLFDEPYSGLFPEMLKTVSGLMRELRAAGKTVVLIEHDMGLIRELCDYAFVMDGGALLASGKPNEVLARQEVIKVYLGE